MEKYEQVELPLKEYGERTEGEEEKAEAVCPENGKAEGLQQEDVRADNAEAVLEAILFTMGESVEIGRLASVLGISRSATETVLKRMEDRYNEEDRGITLMRFEDSVQLCTKAKMYEYLIKIAKTPRKMVLTDTVLETLSIVAYKQPVTRVEIERIRGVSCDHAINKLLEYDLICELGRMDAPGRPLLFGTTEQFLRCFGVQSIEDLPEVSPLQLEELKLQAESEVQLQLDI